MISLQHGEKFQARQKRKYFQTSLQKNNIEGFELFPRSPFQQVSNSNKKDQPTQLVSETDVVMSGTNNLLQASDDSLQTIKDQYDETLQEYNSLLAQIKGQTTSYVTRVSDKNPYLRNFVIFTTGHLCYVTNQGVVKYIPTQEVLTSITGPGGCAANAKTFYLDKPFLDSYTQAGQEIPTTPPLLSGTFMKANQGCGNEGQNVYVKDVVTDISSAPASYRGCFNNTKQVTEAKINPVFSDDSNAANGFTTNCTSVYEGNNQDFGPWRAFDENINTFWHTTVSDGSRLYNRDTGVYEGISGLNFVRQETGQSEKVLGEFIELNLPSATTLSRYEITPRQNYPQREPNTWFIVGRKDNIWYEIDWRGGQSFTNSLPNSYAISSSFSSIPYDAYILLIQVVGSQTSPYPGDRYCAQIAEWNLYTDISTTKTNTTITNAMTVASTSSLFTTFNKCKEYAINNGYKLFGFQNAQTDGTGQCMLSNELAEAEIFGEAVKSTASFIWAANCQWGAQALLNNFGSLQVLNSDKTSIYSTSAEEATPGNYLGTYWDSGDRRLPTSVNNFSYDYDYASCYDEAKKGGYDYFGLQSYGAAGTEANCFLGNDIERARSLGTSSATVTMPDGRISGGYSSNAIYSTKMDQGSNYFLVLQDDGNMVIYRGTWPGDNQGLIWASDTAGKQKDPNPMFTAQKGKYGRNYMKSGETLSNNEFIGSTDGSIYLLFQSDGNLVLYTTTKGTACAVNGKSGDSGYMGNTLGANSLYQIDQPGFLGNLGLLGFVDADSVLYPYLSSNVKTDYTEMKNTNSGGNDIDGAAYTGATVDKCKTTCNNRTDCAGFAFNYEENKCWPKTNQMYPVGEKQDNSPGISIFLKQPVPIQPPAGAPKTTTNIDSIQYEKYFKDENESDFPAAIGLANANSTQKQQLAQLQDRLTQLSTQINDFTSSFSKNNRIINDQSGKNVAGLADYIDQMKEKSKEILQEKKDINTVSNIERQVNMLTIQQNYKYLFWTIILGGILLIFFSFTKRNNTV